MAGAPLDTPDRHTALNRGESRRPSLWLTAYPWNLLERGIDELLARLLGEVGVTGLSVWCATPRIRQFRIRDVHPRLFQTDGGVFFQPSEPRGSASGCRPLVSTWTRAGNPLSEIADHCSRAGAPLRVILPAATIGRLATLYPEFACRNAFDDESAVAVCLANRNVQECILELVSDIASNYAVSGLIAVDVMACWQEAFAPDLLLTSPLGLVESAALSTCFCRACVRASEEAGVDAGEARCRVRAMVERGLCEAVQVGGSLDAFLADQPALADHRRIQTGRLNELLGGIVKSSHTEVLLGRTPGDPNFEGLDCQLPAGVLTHIANTDQLRNAIVAGARRNEIWTAASWLVGAKAQDFVAAMSRAAQLGVAGIDIDNYGILPDTAFTTVKQAIRFARRSTGE